MAWRDKSGKICFDLTGDNISKTADDINDIMGREVVEFRRPEHMSDLVGVFCVDEEDVDIVKDKLLMVKASKERDYFIHNAYFKKFTEMSSLLFMEDLRKDG